MLRAAERRASNASAARPASGGSARGSDCAAVAASSGMSNSIMSKFFGPPTKLWPAPAPRNATEATAWQASQTAAIATAACQTNIHASLTSAPSARAVAIAAGIR